MTPRLLFVLLFSLVVVHSASAQSAVMSNDYWLSYLPSLDNNAPVWILASTNTPQTRVRVTYSEDDSFDEFSINPNQPKEYQVKLNTLDASPYIMAKPSKTEVAQKRSIHIQSSAPISVQQFTDADNNVSIALPIPSWYLGRNYMIAAYNDQDSAFVGNSLLPRSSGEFIIISPEDSTSITIILSGKTSGGLMAGDTASIMLHKGETYWVKGLADSSSNDLSGSRVFADKPVSVIAGAEVMRAFDARVVQNWDYNDHIAECMVPIEQWGTEYISSPLTNKKGLSLDTWGDLIRVFAYEETNLYVNGEKQKSGTRWDFANVTEPLHFSSNKPIMVVQYDYHVDNTTNESSKPRTSNSMMVLQPRHQWVNELSATIPTGYERTYFYITADTDSLKHITVRVNGDTPSTVHSRKDAGTPIQTIGEYTTITIVIAERGQVVFSGPCQFSVRNHGTRDNDKISVTYSYGAVTGSTFGHLTSRDFSIRVDSLCDAFNVVIEDTASNGDGIADIQMIHGQSSNARLIVPDHSIGSKSIDVKIEQITPSQLSKATLFVRTRAGKQRTVVLTLPAHKLSTPQPLTEFKNTVYGDRVCEDIIITNTGASDETITFIMFEKGRPQFSVSTDKDFPFALAPGESFTATVCYIPDDTGRWEDDTLKVDLACTSLDIQAVRGIGKSPIIFAEDKDFKVVEVGKVKQENIRVWNESFEVPLTITGHEVSSNEFFLDSSEHSRFPVVLQPRESSFFNVTYNPQAVGRDTAKITWHTDIVWPNKDSSRKAWSMLVGAAQLPLSVDNVDNVTNTILNSGNHLDIQLAHDERIISASLVDVAGRSYYVNIEDMSTSHLTPAIYFLQIVTSKRTIGKKLILR